VFKRIIQSIGIYYILLSNCRQKQNIDFQVIRKKSNKRKRRGTGKRKGADNFSVQEPISFNFCIAS